jgi:choline dehydrogenase
VRNLRVVDASVLPTMVSGNLNGPVSALAWRAADFILDDAATQ